jgi:hypothetical protein
MTDLKDLDFGVEFKEGVVPAPDLVVSGMKQLLMRATEFAPFENWHITYDFPKDGGGTINAKYCLTLAEEIAMLEAEFQSKTA